MTVKRMDNVGIVVQDLDAAVEFFTELGLTLEGRIPIEGDWAGRVTGVRDQQVEIAMLRTPDGHGRVELSCYHAPAIASDHRTAPVNSLGYLRVMFTVEDLDDTLTRLARLGATVVDEVVTYEDTYRLCYIRGPEGVLIGLAQEVKPAVASGPPPTQLAANVFDVWVFRRHGADVEFLLLYTSVEKANRYFNGGRFWQIPSNVVKDGESVTDAISRVLDGYGLRPKAIWAAEHAYLIYNRRFAQMQAIGVYAAEVDDAIVHLDPAEHAESAWLSREECLRRVHYRGLKDGLRSVHDYVTGVEEPARELCLYVAPGG